MMGGGDDDLYEGFGFSLDVGNNMNPPGTASGFGFGAGAAIPPPSASGFGRMTASRSGRMMTGRTGTGRLGTGAAGERPGTMSSMKAAGYSSQQPKPFDPLNQGNNRAAAPPLEDKAASSPEDVAREMEKTVNALIEQSAEAAVAGNADLALEKAKEAGKKERQLNKHRESNNLLDQLNVDLTYSVCFTLANAYHIRGMYTEALNTYNMIVKNKQYLQSGRLRVNMGNIYYEQGNFAQAVKMYSMALDQIPSTGKDVRYKIMRNIGNAFVRMGQFQDAIQRFEAIMEGSPDFQTGFNLTVCYYALGDVDRMRKGFQKLLSIPPPQMEEEDYDDEAKVEEAAQKNKDLLREELRQRQKAASQFILTAAKLIAPALDQNDWVKGYDWVIEELKHEHSLIASEMQISKALTYLRNKHFDKAIEELKAFEKKETPLKAKAATNLSFLYFVEGNVDMASEYAELAVQYDRYNAKALVNKGNCHSARGESIDAREQYLEAIGVEADCVEAIYNLGLVNKQKGELSESLQAFEKLHTIIPSSPEVLYQIANLHDIAGNTAQSAEYFSYLISKVPTDPGILARLGQLYSKEEDETQAFHFQQESYRYLPVKLDVISWLGVWFVKNEAYEKAIEFFERAAEVEPKEVKWRLMVASCYRRMSNFDKAMELYEQIHAEFPDNFECLRYLVALLKDAGRPAAAYEAKLQQLERSSGATLASNAYGAGATAAGAGGGYLGAQTSAPPPAAAAQHRGYEPGSPAGRGLDDSDDVGLSENLDESIGDAAPMAAPSIATHAPRAGGSGPRREEDEDDFADADLDDLLSD